MDSDVMLDDDLEMQLRRRLLPTTPFLNNSHTVVFPRTMQKQQPDERLVPLDGWHRWLWWIAFFVPWLVFLKTVMRMLGGNPLLTGDKAAWLIYTIAAMVIGFAWYKLLNIAVRLLRKL